MSTYEIYSVVITNPTGYYSFYDKRGGEIFEFIDMYIPEDYAERVKNHSDEKVARVRLARAVLSQCKVSSAAEVVSMPDAYDTEELTLMNPPMVAAWKVRDCTEGTRLLYEVIMEFYRVYTDRLKGKVGPGVYGVISFRGGQQWVDSLTEWLNAFCARSAGV